MWDYPGPLSEPLADPFGLPDVSALKGGGGGGLEKGLTPCPLRKTFFPDPHPRPSPNPGTHPTGSNTFFTHTVIWGIHSLRLPELPGFFPCGG